MATHKSSKGSDVCVECGEQTDEECENCFEPVCDDCLESHITFACEESDTV